MATTRVNPAAAPKICQEDLEDISLFEPVGPRRHSAGTGPLEMYSPVSSISSADDHSLSSNTSNPTLVSDSSSLRSSLSSFSSPALVSTCGPFTTRPTTSSTPALPHIHDGYSFKAPGYQLKPELHSFADQTSMASLSRLPTRRMRTRKQRELDYDNDVGEDFWLQDGLMFNVPMSPALYMQQKNRRHHPAPATGHPPLPDSRGNGGAAGPNGHRRQRSDKQVKNHMRRPSGSLPRSGSEPKTDAAPPRPPPHNPRRKSSTRPGSSTTLPIIEETVSHHGGPAIVSTSHSYDSSDDLSLASMMDHSLSFDYAQEASFTPPSSIKARSTSLPCLNTDLAMPTPIASASSSPRRTSLTRMEHLPPKTPDEEKKHLDEYGKIMAQAAEHEKKRQQQEEQRAQARIHQIATDVSAWQSWLKAPTSIPHKRLRQLLQRGIPQRVRGEVWLCQVGNSLEVTLQDQALGGDETEIIKDCANVWPELGIFQPERPLHQSLVRVVRSFLGLHREIKYRRALSLIAGLLLLELDEESAFVVLCNMLENSLPLAIMAGDEQTVSAFYTPYYKVFRAKFSHLSEHFNHTHIAPQHYLDDMIMSLFADRLDVDTAAHIVDGFLFEGDGFLLQAALGLIRSAEAKLYLSRHEVLEELRAKVSVSDEVLFQHISQATT